MVGPTDSPTLEASDMPTTPEQPCPVVPTERVRSLQIQTGQDHPAEASLITSELRLRERIQHISLLADLHLSLNCTGSLPSMLQQCVQCIIDNLDLALARVWTVSEDRKYLKLQASAGSLTRSDDPSSQVSIGQLTIGQIALNRTPCCTNDVSADSRIDDGEGLRLPGISAFAGYPLLIGDRLLGVVAVQSGQRLTQAALDAMSIVADRIAVGIERKLTNDALQFTQFTIDHVATPVFWVDAQGRFFNVNKSACDLTGYSPEELKSLSVSDLDGSFLGESWGTVWRELCQKGKLALESNITRKDGSEVPVSINANLLKANGREYTCTFIHDISDRKSWEEQLRQSQRMEAVGQLAGGVAHDFNNLLTIILGYSEIVLDALPVKDPLREFVEEIKKAGERSASLTRQLLAFSRKQVLTPKLLDLNEVVRSTEKMLGRIIGEDIQLITKLHPRLNSIKADPGQLEQVLLNLAVNARDAMPQGGELLIETRNFECGGAGDHARMALPPGNYAMVSVADTGAGMSAEVQRHIFEPFFTTKEQGKGTGLGLSVVHGIVVQSNGQIEIESQPGRGTCFRIYFPIVQPDTASEMGTMERCRAPHGTETVLLVEDGEALRLLSDTVLRKHGYTTLSAANPDEAIRLSQSHAGPIDLLLTDVVMPQMNGRMLAELLLEQRPQMKVLYMSGYTDDAIVRQGIVQDGVAFLHKPFSPTSLANKVREVCGPKGN